MPLIDGVIVLVVVGVILWLINTYLPMDAKIKSILNIVVVIVVVLWLLRAFGILGSLSEFRIGRRIFAGLPLLRTSGWRYRGRTQCSLQGWANSREITA